MLSKKLLNTITITIQETVDVYNNEPVMVKPTRVKVPSWEKRVRLHQTVAQVSKVPR
jgi:hypothetical protein